MAGLVPVNAPTEIKKPWPLTHCIGCEARADATREGGVGHGWGLGGPVGMPDSPTRRDTKAISPRFPHRIYPLFPTL